MSDVLGLVLSSAALVVTTLLGVRWRLARDEANSRRTFELTFPGDLSAQAAEAAIRGLAGLLRSRWQRLFARTAVVLEVHADHRGIRHLLKVPASVAPYVCSQLWASGIRLAAVDWDGGLPRLAAAAEFSRPEPGVPLTVAHPNAVAAGMLAALQPLAAGETAVLQWVITPAIGSEVTAVPLDPEPRPPIWRLLLDAVPERWGSPRVLVQDRDWRAQPAFLATLRLGAGAKTPARSRQLVGQVMSSLHRSRGAQATFRRRLLPSRVAADRLQRGCVPLTGFPCLVRADELAALVGFPIGGPSLPGQIELAKERADEATAEYEAMKASATERKKAINAKIKALGS